MAKVTVVIPTYNRAHFIADAIQSVLEQTFTDFELVIVDDGSTDNTKEVVDSFEDPRIRYYACQENQGVAAAANRGFELARGEYIAFFSSDDILMKNALEKGVQVLDKYPEVAFSYGRVYHMDVRGRMFRLRRLRNKPSGVWRGIEEIEQFLSCGNRIPAMTVMARRSCLFEVGLYDLAFRYGSEDIDLFIRLAKKYDVAYIAEPLVKVRKHSGTVSVTRKMDEEEKSKSRVIEGIFNDAELGPLFSAQRPKAYFNLHLRLARHAYGMGDTRAAKEQLFKALKVRSKWRYGRMWLTWIYQFARTCIPSNLLPSVRTAARYLRMVLLRIFHRL